MHLLTNAFVVGRVYRYRVTLWGLHATNGFFRVRLWIVGLDWFIKLILWLQEEQVVSTFLVIWNISLVFAIKFDTLQHFQILVRRHWRWDHLDWDSLFLRVVILGKLLRFRRLGNFWTFDLHILYRLLEVINLLLQSLHLVSLIIFGRLQLDFEFLVVDVKPLLLLYSVFVFQLFQMNFGTRLIIIDLGWHRVKLILLLHMLGHIKNFLLLHVIEHPYLHFLSLLFILSINHHLRLQISLIIILWFCVWRVGQDVLGFMMIVLHLTAFICILLFIFLEFILLWFLFFYSFIYLNLLSVKSFWWQKFAGCVDKIVEIALLVAEELNESSMVLLLSLLLFFSLLHEILDDIFLVGRLLLFWWSWWQGLSNLLIKLLLGESNMSRKNLLEVLPFTLYWRVIIWPCKTDLQWLILHSVRGWMLHKTVY